MSENAPDRKFQQEMHKDFFDRCRVAMDNDCFFEAMLMEYAAIEARLEVIMGVLGLPCNKNLSQEDRRSINISNRIRCLKDISCKRCAIRFSGYRIVLEAFGKVDRIA